MLAMLCIWFHVEAARGFFGFFFFYGLQKTEVTVLLFFVCQCYMCIFFIIFSLILPKFFAAVLPNVLFFLTQ